MANIPLLLYGMKINKKIDEELYQGVVIIAEIGGPFGSEFRVWFDQKNELTVSMIFKFMQEFLYVEDQNPVELYRYRMDEGIGLLQYKHVYRLHPEKETLGDLFNKLNLASFGFNSFTYSRSIYNLGESWSAGINFSTTTEMLYYSEEEKLKRFEKHVKEYKKFEMRGTYKTYPSLLNFIFVTEDE